MTNTDERHEADRRLRELGPVWVSLAEYRNTHGYLHIHVTTDSFRRIADIYLTDCMYISGPTSGGPWTLQVNELRGGSDGVELGAGAGEFIVRAIRIQVSLQASRG